MPQIQSSGAPALLLPQAPQLSTAIQRVLLDELRDGRRHEHTGVERTEDAEQIEVGERADR